jgi:hypothetical protein
MAKLEGLLSNEYYNIIAKYFGEDNYFILSSYGKENESQVERNELLESHVSSRAHADKVGRNYSISHSLRHSHTHPYSPSINLYLIHTLLEPAHTLKLPHTFHVIKNKFVFLLGCKVHLNLLDYVLYLYFMNKAYSKPEGCCFFHILCIN